jgi:L-ribulose-5-phosphate 3-epimerase UlaE
MEDPEYFVYYSTANNRPRKYFRRDHQAAMEWAQKNADKDTVVIKCQVVWTAPDQEERGE